MFALNLYRRIVALTAPFWKRQICPSALFLYSFALSFYRSPSSFNKQKLVPIFHSRIEYISIWFFYLGQPFLSELVNRVAWVNSKSNQSFALQRSMQNWRVGKKTDNRQWNVHLALLRTVIHPSLNFTIWDAHRLQHTQSISENQNLLSIFWRSKKLPVRGETHNGWCVFLSRNLDDMKIHRKVNGNANDTAVESASNLAIASRPYEINIIIKYVEWLSTKPFVFRTIHRKFTDMLFIFPIKLSCLLLRCVKAWHRNKKKTDERCMTIWWKRK